MESIVFVAAAANVVTVVVVVNYWAVGFYK